MRQYSTLAMLLAFGFAPGVTPTFAYDPPGLAAQAKSWEQSMAEVEQLERAGKYSQAEMILLATLKEFGEFARGDSRVAFTLWKIGNISALLGRPTEAERYFLRLVSEWEKSTGPNHPSLVQPLNSLVALYIESGQYGKAERLHRRCLNLRSQTLASDDPESARLLHNLADLHDARGRYREAEPLYRQAMAAFQKIFGPEHREVALVVNNLAMLCQKTGRPAEATSYLEQALKIWEKALGSNHPTVLLNLRFFARRDDSLMPPSGVDSVD